MADNEGGRRELKFADDESANDVFGEELWSEIKEVCGEARRLLGDELPGGFSARHSGRKPSFRQLDHLNPLILRN